MFWLRHVYSAVSNNWDLNPPPHPAFFKFYCPFWCRSSCASIIRSHASHGMHTTPKQTTWHSQNGDFTFILDFSNCLLHRGAVTEQHDLTLSFHRGNKQLNWTEPWTDKNSGRKALQLTDKKQKIDNHILTSPTS